MIDPVADNAEEPIRLLEEYKSALIQWERGHETLSDGSSVRALINRNTPAVRQLMMLYKTYGTVTLVPPPAIGGPILSNRDPFTVVFNNPYGSDDIVSIVCDMIDQTIGVITSPNSVSGSHVAPNDGIIDKRETAMKRVFVVHGRDNESRMAVCRFLESLGLEAIVLHEQPNAGMTIIEKVEKHSGVAFALVLMTPDDVGSLRDEAQSLKPRARQNVIFELGFFMAKLGRDRVCALVKGEIEHPSDSDGILYISLDPSDGWKLRVGKELREAGFDIDLNNTV